MNPSLHINRPGFQSSIQGKVGHLVNFFEDWAIANKTNQVASQKLDPVRGRAQTAPVITLNNRHLQTHLIPQEQRASQRVINVLTQDSPTDIHQINLAFALRRETPAIFPLEEPRQPDNYLGVELTGKPVSETVDETPTLESSSISAILLEEKPEASASSLQGLDLGVPDNYMGVALTEKISSEIMAEPEKGIQLEDVFQDLEASNQELKQISSSQKLVKFKSEKLHTYSKETLEGIQAELIAGIKKECFKELEQFLNTELTSGGKVYQAYTEKKQILFEKEINGKKVTLLARPSGKVYLVAKEAFAQGGFKQAFKATLVAARNPQEMKKVNEFVYSPLSIPVVISSKESEDIKDLQDLEKSIESHKQQMENEVRIHCHLQQCAKDKQMDLSNVLLSHRIRDDSSLIRKNKAEGSARVEMEVKIVGLLTPFCEGGSVNERLASKSLSLMERLELALDIAKGVDQLHKAEVIHFDLHTDNILCKERRALITDFGLSLQGKKGRPSAMEFYCSPPEYLYTPEMTEKSDIYQLGLILFQLINQYTRKEWQNKCLDSSFLTAVTKHADLLNLKTSLNFLMEDSEELKQLDPKVSKALKDLMRAMLSSSENNRPSEEKIIASLSKIIHYLKKKSLKRV